MGIINELHPRERRLILMAMKDLHQVAGHLAMDYFGGTYPEDPEDFNFIETLEQREMLKFVSSIPIRDPDNRISGTRSFYKLTADGIMVGKELQRKLASTAPDDIDGYRDWVQNLASTIVNNAPAGELCLRALEDMKDQINSLPTRFLIVTKINGHEEHWTFEVVQRVGKR